MLKHRQPINAYKILIFQKVLLIELIFPISFEFFKHNYTGQQYFTYFNKIITCFVIEAKMKHFLNSFKIDILKYY